MSSNASPVSRWWASGIRFVTSGAALVLVTSCGPRVDLCPVSGNVLVNGRPAGGVYVVFHAIENVDRQQTAATKTHEDGSYVVRVHGPGEFAVTVFWPEVTVNEGEVIEGEDRFARRHQNPQQPVLKVMIQEGENALPPISLTNP
jgi:hypothetical protein